MRPIHALLLLLAASVLAACVPGRVPAFRAPAAGARLSVGAESFADDGPFRIVFAGPKGEVPAPREVTISFSRAMHALAPLGSEPDSSAPATITRAEGGGVVAGTWRWFGERTAVFWPKDGFAPATEFRVAIGEHARALDGSVLSSPLAPDGSFTFTTARPQLGSVAYAYDAALDQHLLTLSFTQAIEQAEVRRAIRIEGRGEAGKPVLVPYHVMGVGPESEVRLHTGRIITSLEDVTVIAAPALVGIEGPLPSTHEDRIVVERVGPLRAGIVCRTSSGEDSPPRRSARCAADAAVELRLTEEVATADLAKHLVIAPGRRLKLEDRSETTTSIDLSSEMELTAGGKYRVTVKAGLRAEDKEVLAEDQVLDFEIADHPASIGWRDIGREAVVESARPSFGLHLATMNVAGFDAVRAPLDDAQLVDMLFGSNVTASRIQALPGSAPLHVDVKSAKNAGAHAVFELPVTMRAPGGSGFFAVGTESPGLGEDLRVLSITDLGVSTKWSPHGGLVWITRLSSGAPVPDAALSLVRVWRPADGAAHATTTEVFATKTGPGGFAEIPSQIAATFLGEPERTEALLYVRDGADRTYARLPHLSTRVARVFGDLFTERRLYRPGETAYVKGVFRAPTPRGLVSLVGRPATLEVVDDEDRIIFTTTATLDAFGSFSCEVPIPRAVRLGRARVHTRLGGPLERASLGAGRGGHFGPGWQAHAGFTIDEFRTVDFEVQAHGDRESADRDETARFTATGRYLAGGAMHDVPVEVSILRSAARYTPPGLEGFTTDPYGIASRPGWATREDVPRLPRDVKLGADGTASVHVPLALEGQLGPETVRFDAAIADVSGAFGSGDSASVLVHNAELYVGVRAAWNTTVYAGKSVRAELLAASVDGTRRAGLPVHVELLRTPPNGPTVATGLGCDVRTTSDVVSCEIRVTEPGQHWLRASAVDAKGRAVLSASGFYAQVAPPPAVKPPPPPPPPAPPPPPPLPFDEACRALPNKDDHRSITVEGDTYGRRFEVGTSAHVCLRGSGEALLTFEREGVLRRETRTLGQHGTVLDIPITADLAPNVSVSLLSVSGRSAPFPSGQIARSDFGHPSSSTDSIELRVVAPDKKLTVAIETEPEYRPGADVAARVRVTDPAGRPAQAQVTLWAVDEGVILLEPFHVPELGETFSQEHDIDVVDSDTRDHLFWEKLGMHMTKAPSLRQGATQSGPRDHIGRAVFRPTAWFAPSLVTGPDGVATVRAKLPDNLTTWKVFAVAMTVTDGFGSAESSFRTNKPLMVRPQLPRFLRAGDHVDATAIVDSLSKEPLDVKVTMRSEGVLATSGGAASSFVVPPDGHVPVRFALDARGAGRGKVTFHIEAPRAKLVDDVTIELDVAAPNATETIVISGDTKARADERLGDLTRVRSDVGGLDFRLSTSPMVGLAESLTQLVEYPYGCTEQLTSRLVPLVRLRGLSRELGVALPQDVDGAVRSSVSSLLSHQRSDGGFGFWPGSRKSEPWLTVLALGALQAVRDGGFAVPGSSLDRASAYLEHADGLDGPSRAMREDLLASAGRPREKELRALATEALHGKLPLFARALVARALAKVDRALGQQVLAGVASQAHLSGATAVVTDEASLSSRRHVSSDARTTAMVLRAFVALDPKSPLVTKLVRGLLSLRSAGRWPTTQASAWALLALEEARPLFAPAGTGPVTTRLSLDGAEIAKATFEAGGGVRGAVLGGTLPMARMASAPGATLSFTTEGGPLFYEGALRYARREPPTRPLENGIFVTKSMRLLRRDAEPAETSTFRVGDYVEVDVTLASPVARDLVVLDDPIPAGFEAVNQSFANRERQPFRSDPSEHHVTHRELRDDRVVTFFDELPGGQVKTSYVLRVVSGGTYSVPPTKAECMYAPDVFGRTAASGTVARP
jgi:uncharacterized protein YfaS (alpha-2-macroglobulin family)